MKHEIKGAKGFMNTKTKTMVWGAIFMAIFVSPLFVHIDPPIKAGNIHFGLPLVYSGDEPHYMLILSSIIEDHDLVVGNNYDEVRFNRTYSMGARFLGWEGDHHSLLVNYDHDIISWLSAFDYPPPRKKPGKEELDLTAYKEYSDHPIGMPLFVSIFLWPFAYSKYLESAAIILTSAITLIGLYCLYKILLFYSKKPELSMVTTAIIAFATPLWHYSRSFFTEAYISSLLIIALYFVVTKKNYAIAGTLMGLAYLMKFPMALFAGILFIYLASKKEVKSLLQFCIPFGTFVLIQFLINRILFGNATRFSLKPTLTFSFQEQFWQVLFSNTHGLLAFSPFLIFSIIGFYYLIKTHKAFGFLTLSLISVYLIFFTLAFGLDLFSYASREILPSVPLFSIPLLFWLQQKEKSKIFFIMFCILVAFAVILNALSALGHNHVFASTPLDIFLKFLK